MDDYQNPKSGKTYISPALSDFRQKDCKVRIATKLIESPDSYAFAKIKDELVLRHKEGAKSRITAKFFEDDRGIFVLSIQGYTVAAEKPHNASFAFVGDEIGKLEQFLSDIRRVSFEHRGRKTVTDEEFQHLALSQRQAHELVKDNEELFAEVLRSSMSKQDVVAVAYRKRQLRFFDRLLSDEGFLERALQKSGKTKEGLWQSFFEANPWIFGYGLNFVHLDKLDEGKLERVVQGYSESSSGKRADALMKTQGAVSSLCFVEIKTPQTELLRAKSYRPACWSVSSQVSGAIAQVQGTVESAVDSIRKKLVLRDEEGNPTGDEAFNFSPKAYLVVGTLSEFLSENGVNEDKYRSFELFRRNTLLPEIVTFDELYARARFIVEANES